MEASMVQQIFNSLIASGPTAVILGTVCYFLWKQNKELMEDQKDDKKKMLRIAIRTTRAVEAVAGLEEPTDEELGLDEED